MSIEERNALEQLSRRSGVTTSRFGVSIANFISRVIRTAAHAAKYRLATSTN
jgi:hypothetical protein